MVGRLKLPEKGGVNMARKVIQIAVSKTENNDVDGFSTSFDELVIALCDDGSMWCRRNNDSYLEKGIKPKWVRLDDIPEDDEE